MPWGTLVPIAAAYAACYELTHYLSYSHWILPAGLRLACLLLLPYRMWPAIVVGEALPVFENAMMCVRQLGWAWAGISAIPFVLLCIPVVRWIRNRMPLYLADGQINMGMILLATLACALITALRTDTAVFAALMHGKGGMATWHAEGLVDLQAYILGSYLGALTLTPTLLALHERFSGPCSWKSFWRSRLTHDVALGVIPFLTTIVVMAPSGSITPADVQQLHLYRLAVLIPVLVLTMRHGWRGAALAGMLSSIALATTSAVLMDPAMIRAQAVLALTISGSLLAGVSMPHVVTLRPAFARKSRGD
ncbi:MASE1 domain-containing protein [Luteibacter sp. Sphag1AF]|uniref:MASE1 domain-containing protein n=1 Tax=Luteibacter sp. Sphag1AF TaxID=2587031 RepID=UPI00161325F2|nr:MASE1 domain-containing protein [Luteibacter sp. Sphag1AF]